MARRPEGARGCRCASARRPQSRATRPAAPVTSVQLALDLGDAPGARGRVSGLPEMTASERVRAELEILGLDVSRHVVDFYAPFLDALGVVRSTGPARRSAAGRELLVAGVKVATQTPPIRSGRRVVFLTLDDATGRSTRRSSRTCRVPTPPRCSTPGCCGARRAAAYRAARGLAARHRLLGPPACSHDRLAAAGGRSTRRVAETRPGGRSTVAAPGGRRPSRVLVHSSGFRLSPYADIKPAGEATGTVTGDVPRKLWHRSPGSTG